MIIRTLEGYLDAETSSRGRFGDRRGVSVAERYGGAFFMPLPSVVKRLGDFLSTLIPPKHRR